MGSSETFALGVHAARHASDGADPVAPAGIGAAMQSWNLSGHVPGLAKSASNPIFTVGAQGSTFSTIQWPWIVNVLRDTGSLGSFGETYRIYYSTDHEGATARIGMLTATDAPGPWTDRGEVYQDTTVGNQTETPAVVWNPVTSLWHLYYHQVTAGSGTTSGEVTILATSSDAVTNWTRVGVIGDYPPWDTFGYPCGGGIGYFRPWRIGGRWYAHSLLAGGNYARFCLYYSDDGISWSWDPRPLGNSSEWLDINHRVEWDSGTVFQTGGGNFWWVGLVTNFTSGGAARQTYYAAAPIAPTFRSLLATPVALFPTLQTWETSPADNRSGGSLIVDADGTITLAYSGGTIGFGIAQGRGVI